jgi:hypothetical protein
MFLTNFQSLESNVSQIIKDEHVKEKRNVNNVPFSVQQHPFDFVPV